MNLSKSGQRHITTRFFALIVRLRWYTRTEEAASSSIYLAPNFSQPKRSKWKTHTIQAKIACAPQGNMMKLIIRRKAKEMKKIAFVCECLCAGEAMKPDPAEQHLANKAYNSYRLAQSNLYSSVRRSAFPSTNKRLWLSKCAWIIKCMDRIRIFSLENVVRRPEHTKLIEAILAPPLFNHISHSLFTWHTLCMHILNLLLHIHHRSHIKSLCATEKQMR